MAATVVWVNVYSITELSNFGLAIYDIYMYIFICNYIYFFVFVNSIKLKKDSYSRSLLLCVLYVDW